MATALHAPEGIFVIHVRSDSEPLRGTVVGRVEHVGSGDTDSFASLDALLEFFGRYVPGCGETASS